VGSSIRKKGKDFRGALIEGASTAARKSRGLPAKGETRVDPERTQEREERKQKLRKEAAERKAGKKENSEVLGKRGNIGRGEVRKSIRGRKE